MSDFVHIPEYPGYSVSPMGEVRLEKSGNLLRHDARGRVRLRDTAGCRPAFYPGELLAKAGMLTQPDAAHTADNAAKDALNRLELARRTNGHLLALVEQLRAKIKKLETQDGKRRGKPRNFSDKGGSVGGDR